VSPEWVSPASSASSVASIITVESSLRGRFGQDARPPNAENNSSGSAPKIVLPEWSPRFLVTQRQAPAAVVDRLRTGMIGAGRGVEALSFYLGLDEEEVRDRIAALGLAQPKDKRLRRPSSANPWSVEDIRRLIALWLDNVATVSIAATLARSSSSIHGKRRWLGLSVRDRQNVEERPVAQCRKTPLPWRPTFDVSAIVARLMTRSPGKTVGATEAVAAFPDNVRWELGRDEEKDRRFSILAFAGLRSPALARRMLIEFGVHLTDSAVDNRVSRLQIVRDRRNMTNHYDAEEVERRAAESMSRLGAVLRQCSELNRSFWWFRSIGGNRTTCREFYSKKNQAKQANRACADAMGMA